MAKKKSSPYKSFNIGRLKIAYSTFIGTFALIPFAIAELIHIQSLRITWTGWLILLYLGGLASVYGYLAWYRALGKLSAVTVGIYLYFRPFLTGIIAAIILSEKVGVFLITGEFLIIGGTFLTTYRFRNSA